MNIPMIAFKGSIKIYFGNLSDGFDYNDSRQSILKGQFGTALTSYAIRANWESDNVNAILTFLFAVVL